MQQNCPSCSRPQGCEPCQTSALSRCRRALQTLLLALLFTCSLPSARAAQAGLVADVIKADCVEVTCPTNMVVYTCERTAIIRSYPFDVKYTCPNVPPTALSVTYECTPPPGTFAVGVHTVNCVVSLNQKPIGKCTFTITVVQDTEAPKLECPQDMVVLACQSVTGACGTIVNYPDPVASDNSGVVAVTCNLPSGSFFTCGVHTVVCTAFDRCQNATRCEFKIVVREAPPVKIVCPTNPIVVTLPCNSNCVPVTYPAPAVANGTLVECKPPSGTCLPVGDHVVICVAKDECGRTATCEFVVHVRPSQGEPPIIRCPQNIVVTTCDDCEKVAYPAPIVVNGGLAGCNPPSGTCFKPGVHVVTCVATNACGKSSCEFTVTVLQRPPVQIRCPQDIVVETCDDCAVVNYPDPVVVNGKLIECVPPSGTCFKPGVNIVTCLASNQCGRVECKFTVTVRQKPRVSIVCPQDIVVETCDDCVDVKYPAPIVKNGALALCDPPSGSCFKVGTNIVTCLATNDCSRDLCKFQVIVRQKPKPQIRCPEDIVVETCNDCEIVNYPTPIVVNGALAFCEPPSGTCFKPGVTIVHCFATNECGRSECKFTVTVRPGGAKPEIRCPENIVVETCRDCEIVNYPAPVVVNGSLAFCNPPSGSCFKPGVNIVTCVASNNCGRTECKFTVTVRERDRLQIKCPDDIIIETCGEGQVVHFPPPIVIGETNPAAYVMKCEPPSGSFFPIGTNRVVCCVLDRCERRVCCEFNIIVRPGLPCMTPPNNMVLWTPFDEPAGVVAFNAVNGAPSGLHINGPVPILGQKVFNSLGFDGVDDYVAVPNYAAIVLSTNDFSIDAWLLRRDTGGRRVIVSKMGSVPGANDPHGYEFFLNQGVMHLLLAGTVTTDFNSGVIVPADNRWHHVVTTVRRSGGGLVRFFLDGAQVNVQAAAIPAPLANSSRLHIGASTYPLPQDNFSGGIDEVEIFSRPLTLAEVTGLYAADRAGKCKIKCIIPWDTSYPSNGNYVTVMAKICNCSVLPQTVAWMATGPMEIPAPNSGVVFLPPTTCTNIPIKLCRPTTNDIPLGDAIIWNMTILPQHGCPSTCIGSVISPGPITSTAPEEIVQVPGTAGTVNVPVSLGGLPDGALVRIRAIAPGMQPDLQSISLNGLPPGTPWIVNGGGPALSAFDLDFNIPIRFVEADATGLYTILIETDVDGDKDFETLKSFDVENPVIPPPTLRLTRAQKGVVVTWNDEGDGVLESSNEPTGPWKEIAGARPGYLIEPTDKRLFLRVVVPFLVPELKPAGR